MDSTSISSVIRQSFFPSKINPKNLDPSYKMDLDLWNCFGRVKFVLQQNCLGLIQLFVVILVKGKNLSYSRINTIVFTRSKRLQTVLVEAKYEGQSYQKVRIG